MRQRCEWRKDEIKGGRGGRKQSDEKFLTLRCAALHPRVRFVGKVLGERVGNRTFSQKGLTTVLYPVENHCQPTRVCKVSHYTNTYIRVLVKSLPKVTIIVALIKFLDARMNYASVRFVKQTVRYIDMFRIKRLETYILEFINAFDTF